MSRDQTPAGVQIAGQMTPEYAEILTRGCPRLPREAASQLRRPPARAAAAACRSDRRSSMPARCPTFLRETQAIRDADWKVAPVPADLQDRRVEITGPTDRKMVINALNSRRQHVHGRLRGLEHADLGQPGAGPDQPARRGARHDRLREPRGQAVQAQRQDRHAAGAPARLAPGREAPAGRRQAHVRLAVRLRPVLLPQRQGAPASAARAPTSTCPRWRAISRRGCGTTSSCWRRTSSASRRARSRPPC